MTTTFERARVGDKVWGIQYGWGVVMNVRDDSDYAIEVNFQNGTKDCFTCDGKIYKEHDHQTLFWDEVRNYCTETAAAHEACAWRESARY